MHDIKLNMHYLEHGTSIFTKNSGKRSFFDFHKIIFDGKKRNI